MIPVRYVADGERDRRMLPGLVRGVLGAHEVADFTPWSRIQLQGGFGRGSPSGFGRKLRFVIAGAEVSGHGVVAMVDQDGASGRLEELARERDSRPASVPVAVGQAVPHGEAWLIDDLEALRRCVRLSPDARRPRGEPKRAFEELVRAAGLDRLDAIEAVASAIDLRRCERAAETGLAAFVADLRQQFGSSR